MQASQFLEELPTSRTYFHMLANFLYYKIVNVEKLEYHKIITVVSQYVKTIACCYSDPVHNISNSMNPTNFFVSYVFDMLKVPIVYRNPLKMAHPYHATY